jgi:dTDP-4-amino-4,6-dideoxygalactose transaminase
VRVPDRDRVREELARRGVGTLVHYPIPPHRAPAYASDYPEPLPITEQLAATVLSLAMSPHLSDDECAYVCEILAERLL